MQGRDAVPDPNRELVCTAGDSRDELLQRIGAVLAMEAAARGLNVTRLALFEPPFVVDAESRRPPADAQAHVAKLLGEGVGPMPSGTSWPRSLECREPSSGRCD